MSAFILLIASIGARRRRDSDVRGHPRRGTGQGSDGLGEQAPPGCELPAPAQAHQ